jgi:hypothetical protein
LAGLSKSTRRLDVSYADLPLLMPPPNFKPSSRLQIRGFESILRTTAAVSHHVAGQRQTQRQRQRPRAGIACFIEEHLDAFEP